MQIQRLEVAKTNIVNASRIIDKEALSFCKNFYTSLNASVSKAGSTGFYAKVAKQAITKSNKDSVTVLFPTKGLAYQIYGGTIKPAKKKWLTIPASSKYRGVKATSLDLTFVKFSDSLAILFDASKKPAFYLKKKVSKGANPKIKIDNDKLKHTLELKLNKIKF